jgi:outer membrane protein assembly factor BamB
MNRFCATLALAVPTLFVTASFAAPGELSDVERNWHQWRGPLGTGAAPHGDPPTEWSESKNIKWKVEIPGRSHASPVIWNDRIYVLSAVPTGSAKPEANEAEAEPAPAAGERRGRGRRESGPLPVVRFAVLALDRETGKTIWETTVKQETPHERGHQDATQASPSPVTDGKRIYAYFGSRGLFCLDLDGKVLWEKDFGDMETRNGFGEGASPALHGDTLVVNWDHEGDDFIVALDAATGKEKWKKPRDEPTTWATPLIVEHAGKAQVITCGTKRLRSYDLATGELVWETSGLTANAIPTPVHHEGVVYCMSGFRGASAKAIRLSEAKGELKGPPAIIWTYEKDTPYVPSPLYYDGTLYFFENNRPVLTALDAATGKPHYGAERLQELRGFYASPVAASGKVYLAARDGKTAVLKAGPKLEVLAVNVLDDEFDASPAIVGREIFLRGTKSLYCIAAK